MLESLPRYNSCHKYELPKDHLLPPAPRNTEEHLAQISQQLFALCYSVESFVNLPNEEHLLDFSPTVWNFFHEVVLQLPRDLDPKSIQDAQMNLYETMVRTQNTAEFTIDELVNPGASVPDPLIIIADGEPSNKTVPIDTVIDGNPFCARDDFELVQNFLSATDLSEYTIEFIPDEAPQPESLDENEVLVEELAPSKPAWTVKASAKSSKGKAKAKAVESEAEEVVGAPPLARSSKERKGNAKATEVVAEESVEAPALTKTIRSRAKAKAVEDAAADTAPERPTTRGRKAARATALATRPRSARLAAKAAGPSSKPSTAAPAPARAPPKRQRKSSPALTEEIDPDTGIFTGRVRTPRPRSPSPSPPPRATPSAGPSTSTLPPRIEKRRPAESEAEAERAPKRARYWDKDKEAEKRGMKAVWNRLEGKNPPRGTHGHRVVVGGVTYYLTMK
ncbi:hypothetical protein MVEN_02518200 [Mycena venus]|uniref:Uncharacterized protein n=1 Tax=Mycena venus TaxID=2733690 RepID=A0A8H7C9A7_9AGAR|nr:hypothetical protein MVEN_02518200 [Mycena venus]